MSLRTLPPAFEELMRSYGTVAEPLLAALRDSEPDVAVRANALKGIELRAGLENVAWLTDGAYLPERPLFAADPAWHQGLYYVQDASSMAMTALVRDIAARFFEGAPLRYLDACAAPGGKTIAAIEGLPAGSAVLANEYDRRRAAALVENTGKHGYPAIAISCTDAATLGSLGPVFDIVAVDAPCSGEGMMRKEPEAIRQWSPSLIDSCAATQRHILGGVWEALRPGGVLIYSTCTFNRSEDEDNVRFIVEELGGESIDTCLGGYAGVQAGIDTPYSCCRFMPGHVRGEGLFIAAVRKPEGDCRTPKMKFSPAKSPVATAFADSALAEPDKFVVAESNPGTFTLYPVAHAEFFAYLASKLRLQRCGLPLCTIKGKDAIPSWELAFSTVLRGGAFAELPLDYAGAMAYLHGDSMTDLPDGLARGIVLATYGGHPLGWAKNIGRRANNLYPDALRLRMEPPAQQPDNITV